MYMDCLPPFIFRSGVPAMRAMRVPVCAGGGGGADARTAAGRTPLRTSSRATARTQVHIHITSYNTTCFYIVNQ